MAQLTCDHLWLGYEGRPVLEDLSFSVQAGDYLCIVGENGSGKTTLMRTILGLQKPLQGSIRFGDGLREGGIGYLPQQTNVQKDFPATVREVVLPCHGQGGCAFRMPGPAEKPAFLLARRQKTRGGKHEQNGNQRLREALLP